MGRMHSNYCICDVSDHVFQSPLDWKCIFVYWKETETYISSWLCPWVIQLYIFARKFSIKSPTRFLPTNWWKGLTRGMLRDEPQRQGSTFGGRASLRTSLWLLLWASSLADYHSSKDRQRAAHPESTSQSRMWKQKRLIAIFYSCNGIVEEYWKIKPCCILCILVTLIDMSNICII